MWRVKGCEAAPPSTQTVTHTRRERETNKGTHAVCESVRGVTARGSATKVSGGKSAQTSAPERDGAPDRDGAPGRWSTRQMEHQAEE